MSHTRISFQNLPFSLFGGTFRTKAAFSKYFQLSLWKVVSHECCGLTFSTCTFLREVSHESVCESYRRCTENSVLQNGTCPAGWMGKLARQAVAEHVRLNQCHVCIGPEMEMPDKALFSQFDFF